MILEKYNLDRIYADVVTGSKFDRPEYKKLTEEILREGDELYIKEVDRLGRNKRENLEELRKLKERGIIIRILEIPTTLAVENNQTEQNKMLIEMMNNMLIEVYTTFAELELQKIRTRTKEKKYTPAGLTSSIRIAVSAVKDFWVAYNSS